MSRPSLFARLWCWIRGHPAGPVCPLRLAGPELDHQRDWRCRNCGAVLRD